MDEYNDMEAPFDADEHIDYDETDSGEVAYDNPAVEQASSEYLRSWNRLISTTNWEKGRIIHQWREALIAVGAPQAAYADEAWSRRVGNVTPQHVGRLRRVYVRFYDDRENYNGLFWSHFQAALDWDDAEMWLEGAVQNGWSVASMREHRWEAVGAPADQRPRDEDIIIAELDEDAPRPDEVVEASDRPSIVQPTDDEERQFGDDMPDPDDYEDDKAAALPSDFSDDQSSTATAAPCRPFEDVPELPPDLTEAVESMKLAIIRHRMSGWRDVYCDDVLAALNALRQLALAPPEKNG